MQVKYDMGKWDDVRSIGEQFLKSECVFLHDIAEKVTDEFPDEQITIVNIGILLGASCHCFRLGASEAKLLAIDINGTRWMNKELIERLDMVVHAGNSNYLKIVKGAFKGPYHLVFIDGGHEVEVVTLDILKYCPEVVVGGYVLFHDSGYLGPFLAIKRVLPKTGKWECLTTKENHAGTMKLFRKVS